MSETPPAAPRASAWWHSSAWWPLAGILLLVAVNVAHNPAFLDVELRDGRLFGPVVDLFNRGSICLMLALGMTLVIATGGIDLSVGAVMALAGSVAVTLLLDGHSLVVVLGAGLGAALLCGACNGALVAWARLQPIVATLVMMVAGRGLAQAITATNVRPVPAGTHLDFAFLGKGYVLGVPFAPLLVTACFLLAWLALRRTAAGLFVEAVGDNETASRFAGLGSAGVKCFAYAACGLCAGLAGLIESSNHGVADPLQIGLGRELDAIVAVVVGGTALSGGRFSLLGSYLGALLVQLLVVSIPYLGIPPHLANETKAVVILAVCVMQAEVTRRALRAVAAWGRRAPA